MFVVESYPTAVLLCITTMLCWGSWANTQKAVGKRWRFELFYWDYVFGVLLAALVFAFTLGSMGTSGRSFLADVAQADPANVGSALLGGVVFNAANILLVAAIALSGMAVAFPVGIGLALVLGVVVNYMADPKGNPTALFLGVAFIMVAIVLDALAYGKLPREKGDGGRKGLALAVLCGILMGYFYRFVAAAMPAPEQFAEMPAGKLSPYTAVVFFALGIVLSPFVLAVFGDAGAHFRLLQGHGARSSLGHRRRHDLGGRHDVEHRCGRQGKLRHLLWFGPGRHARGGLLGRVHLARVSQRASRRYDVARIDVPRLCRRTGACHRSKDRLK
jgi:glucose uptake protein GlcU